MAALSTSRGRHSGYTCLSGFFPRVSKKQLLFCSLQIVFFLLDVFPSISSLPLLGNSFSVFVGFEIGPLVVKDIQREKDSLKGAEEKLFLCKTWKEAAETGVTNVSTA